MFPWVCLATLPVFCSHSWPRRLLANLSFLLPGQTPTAAASVVAVGTTRSECEEEEKISRKFKRNPDCCYPGEGGCVTTRQRVRSLLVVGYVLLQLILPFSHSITKGYNTWTDGPYGYSWDMMVHSWDTLHVKITGISSDTGEKLYLDPNVWLNNHRWTSHADMAVQYGRCLRERLASRGVGLSSLHFDVWKSLNHRFQQRVFDPTVNILEAPWSPWEETPWVLPLASSLSPWRDRLPRLLKEVQLASPAADAIFVADFPGLTLENFLSEDLSNITLEVLQGEVKVLLPTEDQSSSSGHTGATGQDADGTGTGLCAAVSLKDVFDAYQDIQSRKGRRPNILKEQLTKNYDPTQDKRFSKAVVRSSGQVRRQGIQDGERNRMTRRPPPPPPPPAASTTVQPVVLRAGERLVLPSNAFHSVITTSRGPSSYMYTFINTTLQRMYHSAHDDHSETNSADGGLTLQSQRGKVNDMPKAELEGSSSRPTAREAYAQPTQELENSGGSKDTSPPAGETNSESREAEDKHAKKVNHKRRNPHLEINTCYHHLPFQVWQDVVKFLTWKWTIFKRSGRLFVEACRSVLSGTPMKFN